MNATSFGAHSLTAEERAFSQILLRRPATAPEITIGLVNNMPDAELHNTELQFRTLLAHASAATGLPVRLRAFSMPELPRSETGKKYIASSCEDIANLKGSELDALIVTGAEPRAATLKEERYWKTFTEIVEWSAENTLSAIWSCLAAHASVLCLDNIERNPFPRKLTGIFDCATIGSDLFDGTGSAWGVPHSRYNGLQEPELKQHSYRILSYSPGTGPDSFVKQLSSLFVFLQGHPEYDPEALLREYRRDVGRYLRGVSTSYPHLPLNYFDEAASAQLLAFRERALHAPSTELLAQFPDIAATSLRRRWQQPARAFYASWLRHIATERRKRETLRPRHFTRDARPSREDKDSMLFPESTTRRRWQDHLSARLDDAARKVKSGAPVPSLDLATFRKELAEFEFVDPRDLGDVLEWTIRAMEQGNVQPTHPRYMGLFNPRPTLPSECADRIVSVFNPQLATSSTSPAAVAIEQHTIEAVARRAGLAAEFAGHFTTGGSEANLTALLCALTQASPGFIEDGVRAFAAAPVFYVSRDSHLAWLKIAQAAGLGRQAVRFVVTDGNGRMDAETLRATMLADRAKGFVPVMIVATAGTTNAGMIDPLPECARLAEESGTWFHVDAAWGGAVIASDRLRPLLSGLERCDSFTLDAHKWLATPMGCGMFVTRRPRVLTDVFHVSADFMPPSADAISNPYSNSIQWSRRFTGLRLFLSLAAAGWAGYAAHVERAVSLAELLRTLLLERGWRVLNRPHLAVLCAQAPSRPADDIVRRVLASGAAWVSKSRFEGEDVVRICVTNGETTRADIAAVADCLERADAALQDCNGHK